MREKMKKQRRRLCKEIIVKNAVGDFNIDKLLSSFYSNKLQSIIASLGVKQYVKESTRSTIYARMLIDIWYLQIIQ